MRRTCDDCQAPLAAVLINGVEVLVDARVEQSLEGPVLLLIEDAEGTIEWTGRTERRRNGETAETESLKVCRWFDPFQERLFGEDGPKYDRYRFHQRSCPEYLRRHSEWRPSPRQAELGLRKIDQIRGQLHLND